MLQDTPMYCHIPALDLPRARRFYEHTLGLVPEHVSAAGVRYRMAGGTACFLYPTPNAGTSLASQGFWAVSDVAREREALRQRGVVFEDYDLGQRGLDGIYQAPAGALVAWFKDSEGNLLTLVQVPAD